MSRARVVHVTTTDMSLALLLGPQLRALQETGYEVVGASAPGPYVGLLEEWGIRHVSLRHATRARAPGRDLVLLGELYRLFRRLRPEVVHTHNPKPGVLGRLAARAAGVPVVVNTVHGLYAQPSDPWPRRAAVYGLERLAAACSHAELVQSPEDVPVLRRLGVLSSRVRLLGNGVDLARFAPGRIGPDRRRELRAEMGAPTEAVVVGVVGRLVWEKGYREVFDAAAQLRRTAPSARFVVVGPEDPDKSDAVPVAARAQAERLGVVFLGARDDVADLYGAFDLYVLASYREGFPRSAMEAAASGLPVVATDIRGCRQVVDHGTTGILVPPRDAGALAAAVADLVADAGRRSVLGAAGRAKAEAEFDQADVIAAVLATYARLTGKTAPRAAGVPGVTLRWATPADAPRLAALHVSEIGEGFLATLGSGFLRALYRRVVRDPGSFAVVAATDNEDVVGFVAGTVDTAALYRRFLARDGAVAGASALPRLARSWRSTLETLRYGARPPGIELPPAELLSLAVAPEVRGRGIARALVRAFQEELVGRGVTAARVVVGGANGRALAVYTGAGFRAVTPLEVHRGTASVALVWP